MDKHQQNKLRLSLLNFHGVYSTKMYICIYISSMYLTAYVFVVCVYECSQCSSSQVVQILLWFEKWFDEDISNL